MAHDPGIPGDMQKTDSDPESLELRTSLLADVEHGRELREQSRSLLQRLLQVLQSLR
jgi:hypothetical protein